MLHWYVLVVHSNREKSVCAKLADSNVETYVPMRVAWRKFKGRSRERREYVLIPGYVFIKADLRRTSVLSLCRTKGAVALLGACGEPLAVSPAEIERLRASVAAGAYDDTVEIAAELTIGQKITLGSGPYAGTCFTVESVTAAGVFVDMTMMGVKRRVFVGVDTIAEYQ